MSTPATAPDEDGSRPDAPVRPDLLLSLRSWQKTAYREYFRLPRRDFLLVATPGAGKTAWALTIAAELLARREIATVTVVTPTEHLKHQWAQAAHYIGISLDSSYRNAQGRASADFTGVAVTYAQVAAHPILHRQRTVNRRTLVIFDEIHHAGDALSWGDAVREAFEPARRRLALTGTPFRSDANPIPFVAYAPDTDGSRRSVSDYVYGYGPALDDGVVRPVIFLAYSGEMRWRTRAGDEITGTLGTPMLPDQLAQAWRTALDPQGEWVQRVLEAADRRLTEVRRGMPDAGGLVIAGDHADARAYAALLRRISGTRPVVVLSDDPTASRKIAAFSDSGDRWMVAVRMVSEGVDIPRLAVGVYATSVGTALFFAQAVGRFVRARQRGETASVFLPSIPTLLGYAAELEAARDHVLAARPGRRGRARAGRGAAPPGHPGHRRRAAVRGAAGVRALRPGPLRRHRVRHLGGGRGLPGPARAARPRAGRAAAAQTAERAAQAAITGLRGRRRRPAAPRTGTQRPRVGGFRCGSWSASGGGRCSRRRRGSGGGRGAGPPGGPGRPAQGAERADRRLAPPHRTAARGGPCGPAPGVRRPAAAAGHRGADPGAHRDDPPLGQVRPLATAQGPPAAPGRPISRSSRRRG